METIIKSNINIKSVIKKLPFLMMPVFCIIHMGMYVHFAIGGREISLSFINAGYSLLYVAVLYLWALFASEKTAVKLTAIATFVMSCICFLISYSDFGKSFNDLLFTGTAILSLLYVMENMLYLLEIIREHDKYITITIWAFIAFSVILFVFFPFKVVDWGKGNYFFGHKYASVCGHILMLVWLKLSNRPAKPFIYWGIMLLGYGICFWTGARVYNFANLGIVYGAIYCFRKTDKDFIIKCVAVTIVAMLMYVSSPTVEKSKVGKAATAQAISNIIKNSINAIKDEETIKIENPKLSAVIDGLGHGRASMWGRCFESYTALPTINKLFGSGNKYMYDNNNATSSHMDFLNILHFHGIIGLSLYLLVFVGGTIYFWRKNKLPLILFIGFVGVWLCLATLNGYASYTANAMTLPYILPMAILAKRSKTAPVTDL